MKRKNFIVLLLVLILFACAVPMSSCSLSGGSFDLSYDEIEQDGEVIGYSVKKRFGSNPKKLTIPAEHNGKPVTKIERFAFHYCKNLESIVLPDTITEIGWDAFLGCIKLKNVYITDLTAWCNIKIEGDWATPFYYNADLYVNKELVKDLKIPDGVTKISMYAFKGSNISSVTIPSSVENIEYAAFTYCYNLRNIYLNEGLISIARYAFAWCESLEEITFPEGFKRIGESAFFSCNSLVSVTLPNSMENIGGEAFKYCFRMARVINFSDLEIQKGSERYGYIGTYALNILTGDAESMISKTDDGYMFYTYEENKYLINYTGTATQLTLPSVSTIGNYAVRGYAFYELDKITDITIAEGVQSIGGNAFDNCKSLKNIKIPQSVTHIGSYAFWGCENLKSVAIPDGVTEISINLFGKCSSLERIEIPQSVTRIGSYAFWKCENLKSVVVPDGVTEINDDAFGKCSSLKSITLPENLELIGAEAFYETAVSEIIFKGTMEQWNAITKMKNWDDFADDYTVCCTDGQIQSSH